MTPSHADVPVSPLQLAIRSACISVENQFERRINRLRFSLSMLAAALAFYALGYAEVVPLAKAPWYAHVPLWAAVAAVAAFGILQIVRRLHDLERSGGLFWALAVPFWAFWKMTSLFPNLWYVWLLLCLWPIKLTLALFFKAGAEALNS
jgi:uncharacterized membrane protein YhaH (DUF805 family)